MPGGDGTGPAGLGPMTGRAAGYCAGYPVPGFMNPMPGRAFWGRGAVAWGWRPRFYAPGVVGRRWAAYGYPAFGAVPYAVPYVPAMTPEQEVDLLKRQARSFESALDGIKKRIEELETEARKK